MTKKLSSQNSFQHVLPRTDGWAVKRSGSSKDTRVFSAQSEAIDFARQVAKKSNSEVLIHSRDGRIRERNSYGNDPHPPKG